MPLITLPGIATPLLRAHTYILRHTCRHEPLRHMLTPRCRLLRQPTATMPHDYAAAMLSAAAMLRKSTLRLS